MTVKLCVIQGRPAGKSLAFPTGDYYIGAAPSATSGPTAIG